MGEKKNKNTGLFFIVSNPAFSPYVMKFGSCPGNECLSGPLLQSHKGLVKCFLAVTDLVWTDWTMYLTTYIFGCEWVRDYLRIIIKEHVWNFHFLIGVVDGSRHVANSQHTILYHTWRNTGEAVTVSVFALALT